MPLNPLEPGDASFSTFDSLGMTKGVLILKEAR